MCKCNEKQHTEDNNNVWKFVAVVVIVAVIAFGTFKYNWLGKAQAAINKLK
jgi:hypothetical protein